MGYEFYCINCGCSFNIQTNSPNSVNHCPICGSTDIEENDD